MTRLKKGIILLNLLAFLTFMVYAVWQKETILKEGKLISLKLAPIDPRSLLQGDYMELRYEIVPRFSILKDMPLRGFIIVTLDSNGLASYKRWQKNSSPLGSDEWPIEYTRTTPSELNIGAPAYFFEEGMQKKYSNATYGLLRVDKKGRSVLVGLR